MNRCTMLLALAVLLILPQMVHAVPPGDGCAYAPDYWADNPDQWPVDQLEVGQVVRDQAELLSLLDSRGNGPDLGALMRETIAARLNVANGAPGDIEPYITWADFILALGTSNDRRVRSLRSVATMNEVRRVLADYNQLGCSATPGAARLLMTPITLDATMGELKASYRD